MLCFFYFSFAQLLWLPLAASMLVRTKRDNSYCERAILSLGLSQSVIYREAYFLFHVLYIFDGIINCIF